MALSHKTAAVFAPLAVFVLAFVSYNAYSYFWTREYFQLPPLSEGMSTKHLVPVDDAAEYRRLLSTVNPLDGLPHSKTLGVASRLYVIGLPGREDRRIMMGSLQKAMDLTFSWHNATSIHSPIIPEIEQRIRYAREESRKGREEEFPPPDSFPFTFADDVTSNDFLEPGDISGSEQWFLPPSSPLALPPLPAPSPPESNNTKEYDPKRLSEIACWHSHFEVLRKIADGDDDVALIFEDDIDMEWDLERRLRYLWKFLPDKWDLVLIGHCFSYEYEKEPLPGTSYLYPSTSPLCTHAYAVTKKGATRLVRLLRSSLYAYSRPIDHAYRELNWDKHIDSFSVYPPIVTQSSTTTSDIFGGMGPGGFYLMDSALERARLLEASKQVKNSQA